jgi:starvation-inducible DNA-binding protein
MNTAVLKTDVNAEDKPHISVSSDDARKRLSGALAKVVGDTYMLMAKTQGYHWNVAGPLFVSIHELTEKQYQDLFEAADDLAERIRALGERAPGGYREFSAASVLEDDDGSVKTAREMVEILAHDNEACARRLKEVSDIAEELGDKVTEDMAIERMQTHEQNAWMLRAIAADES